MNSYIFLIYFILVIVMPKTHVIIDFICFTLSLADIHGTTKCARTYIRIHAHTHKHTKNKVKNTKKGTGKREGGSREERKKIKRGQTEKEEEKKEGKERKGWVGKKK